VNPYACRRLLAGASLLAKREVANVVRARLWREMPRRPVPNVKAGGVVGGGDPALPPRQEEEGNAGSLQAGKAGVGARVARRRGSAQGYGNICVRNKMKSELQTATGR